MDEALISLNEAVDDHHVARLNGWNNHPFFLYERGPSVVRMTPKREDMLLSFGNKIMTTETIPPEDVKGQIRQFLFMISPCFNPNSGWRMAKFQKWIWKLKNPFIDYKLAIDGIWDYINSQYADSPSKNWKPDFVLKRELENKEEEPQQPLEGFGSWKKLENPRQQAFWLKFINDNYPNLRLGFRDIVNMPYTELYELYWVALESSDSGNSRSRVNQYISAENAIIGKIYRENKKAKHG